MRTMPWNPCGIPDLKVAIVERDDEGDMRKPPSADIDARARLVERMLSRNIDGYCENRLACMMAEAVLELLEHEPDSR